MLFLLLLTLAVGLFVGACARQLPVVRTLAVPIVVAIALMLAVTVAPSRPDAGPVAAVVVLAVTLTACTLTVSKHAGRTNRRRLLTTYRALRSGTSWVACRPVMPLGVAALPG